MTDPIDTKEEIIAVLRAHKAKIECLGVKKIGIFGSFSKNKQRQGSDVDLLVEFLSDKKTFKNFMRLAFLLEDLFRRRVEIVTPESLSPYLKTHIMRDVEYVLQ